MGPGVHPAGGAQGQPEDIHLSAALWLQDPGWEVEG